MIAKFGRLTPTCIYNVMVIRVALSRSTIGDSGKPTEKGGLYFCVYVCVDNVNATKLWYYLINEKEPRERANIGYL